MKIYVQPNTNAGVHGGGDKSLIFRDYFITIGKSPIVEVIKTETGRSGGFYGRECSEEFGEKIIKLIEDEFARLDKYYIRLDEAKT